MFAAFSIKYLGNGHIDGDILHRVWHNGEGSDARTFFSIIYHPELHHGWINILAINLHYGEVNNGNWIQGNSLNKPSLVSKTRSKRHTSINLLFVVIKRSAWNIACCIFGKDYMLSCNPEVNGSNPNRCRRPRGISTLAVCFVIGSGRFVATAVWNRAQSSQKTESGQRYKFHCPWTIRSIIPHIKPKGCHIIAAFLSDKVYLSTIACKSDALAKQALPETLKHSAARFGMCIRD